MSREVIAHINLSALQHNFQVIKKTAPQSRVLAMIKSNAYGHDLIKVAEALPDADAYGVACLNEAVVLRQSGISKPIVTMCGFTDMPALQQLIAANITPLIHAEFQVSLLEQANLPQNFPIWLKIDSGMHRLGIDVTEVENIVKRLSAIKNVQQPVGLMTHLAEADNKDRNYTQQQIDCFTQSVQGYQSSKSIANSAGLIAYPEAQLDWVRPGIMLYGASPFAHRTAASLDLKPVMTLTATLMAIKKINKNTPVGYGCTWRSPEAMTVGVVGIGYGDGYPRHIEANTPVLLQGKRTEILGRVSMDLTSIDLRSIPNAKVGDEVTLWGEGLPIEEIAARAGTISYELLTKLTSRVQYNYKGE